MRRRCSLSPHAYSQSRLLSEVRPLVKIISDPLIERKYPIKYSKAVIELTEIFSIKEHLGFLMGKLKPGCRTNHFLSGMTKGQVREIKELLSGYEKEKGY